MLTLLKPWTKNWRRAAAITAWAAERSVDNLSALEVRTGMDHQRDRGNYISTTSFRSHVSTPCIASRVRNHCEDWPLGLLFFFYCALDFAACFSGFDGFAAVIEFLALGESEFHLRVAALREVDTEGNEREPLLLRLPQKLVDLSLVEQEFPNSGRVMIHDVAMAIGTHMTIVEKHLSLTHGGKAVLEVYPSFTQRFHLCALQYDSGFEFFLDKIVMERLAVRCHNLSRGIFVLRHDFTESPCS